MRTAIVALLALVAVAAAGLWGLAQYGAPRPMKAEEHAPVAKIASSTTGAAAPLAPAQRDPGAAHPNAADTLKTEKPKADAAKPAASKPDASKDVVVAEAAPPADARPADASRAMAKTATDEKLKTVAPPSAATTTTTAPAPGFAPAPSAASAPPPPPAAPLAPTPDLVQTASAPATAAAAAPAAASASLADQFKTRKVAYNRPPSTLYLDRPIDISLVIDATAAADPAAQLQGFPGQVVERDVSLSSSVSARLTGVGFDIASQNPGAERQVLSTATPNRWQWRVTPTEPGTHTLTLDIFGYKANSLDAEPLDAYRDQITVQVQQLDSVIKWAKGIQPLFAVIAAIAGLLSALIAVLRFRRDGKKSG